MPAQEAWLHLAGNRIVCRRCQGKSRRTGRQCAAPAEVGRRWCRFHGARSRGATTAEGRLRCAAAKTVHGKDTRFKRKRAQLQSRLIRSLTTLAEFLAGDHTQQDLQNSPIVMLVFDQIYALELLDRSRQHPFEVPTVAD